MHPERMQNNSFLGHFQKLWANLLHTAAVQVLQIHYNLGPLALQLICSEFSSKSGSSLNLDSYLCSRRNRFLWALLSVEMPKPWMPSLRDTSLLVDLEFNAQHEEGNFLINSRSNSFLGMSCLSPWKGTNSRIRLYQYFLLQRLSWNS